MQIVIDISDATYVATCKGNMLPPDVKNAVEAIKNGVPLNKVLDKIIAEICNLNCEYIEYGDDYCGCDAHINEKDVLAILDKYKAESEES